MDRMTTPSNQQADGRLAVMRVRTGLRGDSAKRLRANWPALLLPALAAEMLGMFRFHDHAPWLLLFAVTVVFVGAEAGGRGQDRAVRAVRLRLVSASSSRTRC